MHLHDYDTENRHHATLIDSERITPEASPDDWAGGPPRNPSDGVDAARLLARLDPQQREALELTRYAGYSLAEAAERTGVSMTAMKSRVHRAIRNVRRLLEAEGPTA